MANMVLNVKTNKVGSTCVCDLGYTAEEWEKMSEEEQTEITSEAMWNVLEVWTEAV